LINQQHYKWFFEPTTTIEGHTHAIRRNIVETRTKYQHAEIKDTYS
jgi:spermidine synthase